MQTTEIKSVLPTMTDHEVRIALEKGEKEKVILNYIRLARDVTTYVNRSNYFQDPEDMFGVAILALVTGVEKIPEGHPEPGKYFWTRMRYHVINFCKRSHLIAVPDKPQLLKYNLDIFLVDEDHPGEKRYNEFFTVEPNNAYGRIQETKALTPREKQIIDLRLEGKSITEIARELNTNFSKIQRALKDMKTRVLKVLDGEY